MAAHPQTPAAQHNGGSVGRWARARPRRRQRQTGGLEAVARSGCHTHLLFPESGTRLEGVGEIPQGQLRSGRYTNGDMSHGEAERETRRRIRYTHCQLCHFHTEKPNHFCDSFT